MGDDARAIGRMRMKSLPRKHGGGRKATYAAWSVAALLVLLALMAPAAFVNAKGDSGGGRPTSVTFKYHAFGAASPASITLTEDDQSLSTSTVADPGTFTVTATGGDNL